jgi:hypothetical protein
MIVMRNRRTWGKVSVRATKDTRRENRAESGMSSAVTARFWFIWMTTVDGRDHAVTDEEMAVGHGVYRAVCTMRVLPEPLVAPPGPRCPRCVATVRAAQVRTARDTAPEPAHSGEDPGRRRARHRLRGQGLMSRLTGNPR